MEKIVTKDWLKYRLYCYAVDSDTYGSCVNTTTVQRVLTPDHVKVLGRALVAIYNNQTGEEKASGSTKILNGVGFTGPDAKLGTRAAKAFLATNTLPDWLAKAWLVEKNGYPRICKYTRQLNAIANAKKCVAL